MTSTGRDERVHIMARIRARMICLGCNIMLTDFDSVYREKCDCNTMSMTGRCEACWRELESKP